MSSVSAKKINSEFNHFCEEIDAVASNYGTNSNTRYLIDHQYRIKDQIRSVCELIRKHNYQSMLSIGGWPGTLAIVASRITGVKASLLDHPDLLSEPLKNFYLQAGIQFFGIDLRDFTKTDLNNKFDLIECCQCIEHWNFNPLFILQKIFTELMTENGRLYLTAPNASSFFRRSAAMAGRNPFPPMKHFIEDAEGAEGAAVASHWREYTKTDLSQAASYSGGLVEAVNYKSYPKGGNRSLTAKLYDKFHPAIPGFRENLELIARRLQN